MGTSIKTTQFAFAPIHGLVDNTLTALTDITIYIPEGSPVFRSVVATLTADDIITATGGTVINRRMQLGLGGSAKTNIANANTLANSGENMSLLHTFDMTARFTTSWTGTSMTCQVDVLIDQSTGTTLGWNNVCVTLDITYEYDDTSATQVKTVWLPLDAPTGALATTKPGVAIATIPALDTHLPEASKTYRQINIWRVGNTMNNASGVDATLSMEVDTDGASTTGSYEGSLATDRIHRYVDTAACSIMTTNATHGFYIWASVARFNHQQIWLQVTYEFNASTSTSMFVSLMLPMTLVNAMGGTTSADYQRGALSLWIQETSIAGKEVAFFPHWSQAAVISGLNMRIGTGSFVTYTDSGGNYAGGNCAMVRNDSAFTLARGRNALTFDVYRTDTVDYGMLTGGFWIVNYQADKPSAGVQVANKTIMRSIAALNDTAINSPTLFLSSIAPLLIPETAWCLSADAGLVVSDITFSASAASGLAIDLSIAAGGWRSLYSEPAWNDQEAGWLIHAAHIAGLFHRWASDIGADRVDPETAANWRLFQNNLFGGVTAYYDMEMWYSYHSITYTVAGSITGSAGGTVTINLHRASDGELLATTSRVGDGAYSLTWYDNTENVFVSAYEDGTHVGRSAPALAGT